MSVAMLGTSSVSVDPFDVDVMHFLPAVFKTDIIMMTPPGTGSVHNLFLNQKKNLKTQQELQQYNSPAHHHCISSELIH